MYKVIAVLSAVCLVVLLARAVPAPRQETVLTILHTNDLHGHVLSSSAMEEGGPGGLARISAMARRVRAEMPNVVFLDAGDIIHGTPTEMMTQGASMLSAMNAAGYDAAVLGNHEFDWSQNVTERVIGQARFPILSANVRDRRTGGTFAGAREYILLRRGPLRVAVFGLTTPTTVRIEWPAFISRVRFDDPEATARRLVPELRRRADVVIALSHLGIGEDRALAAAVPGIDVIVSGHSHTTLEKHEKVGQTLIAQTGFYARNLGRMDLLMSRSGTTWRVASVNGRGGWWADKAPPLGKTYPRTVLLPVTAHQPRDPAVVAAYRPAWDDSQRRLETRLAETSDAIPGENAARQNQPMQTLMADLLREKLRADVAVMHTGMGPAVPAGEISLRTVYDVVGGYTRQNVVGVRATGRDVRAAVLKAYPQPGGFAAYFSGVGGVIVHGPDGPRWDNATVNGQPLRDDATYLVVGGAYPIMDYPSLMGSPLVSDRYGWLKPLLADAMRERKMLRAPQSALRFGG